jgi:hypothetical protein
MILNFQNSQGIERKIGQPNNQDEVMTIINQFLDERKFKSYYTRAILSEDGKSITYDVGSHTEFFVLYMEEE